jgi:CheY-like chemotaxis protein
MYFRGWLSISSDSVHAIRHPEPIIADESRFNSIEASFSEDQNQCIISVEEDDDAHHEYAPMVGSAGAPATRQLVFLIVDDSMPSRKMLRRSLMLNDFLPAPALIIDADDGETGVEAMRQSMMRGQHIDCVLMDFTMIRMHGPEATRLMRQELGYRGLIIGVTGNVLPSDRQKLLDAGANAVLGKPMRREDLLDILVTRGVIT